MRHLLTAGLAMLALTPASWALDEPPEKEKENANAKASTPRQRYQALFQEHQKAMQTFMEAYQKAETQEAKNKLFEEKYPAPAAYIDRFLKIAESAPEDPAAFDALSWVVRQGRTGPGVIRAIDQLATRHADNPKLGDVAGTLVYTYAPGAERLLRAILEQNPSRMARGQACFALGRYLKRQSELVRSLKEDPQRAQQLEAFYIQAGNDKEGFARLSRKDPDALDKEVEALFERTVQEFGDVSRGRDTLGEAAQAELFEIRNLGIGKPAPEIVGEDIDGAPFKLSDYKGKVVVVDFWGDW